MRAAIPYILFGAYMTGALITAAWYYARNRPGHRRGSFASGASAGETAGMAVLFALAWPVTVLIAGYLPPSPPSGKNGSEEEGR